MSDSIWDTNLTPLAQDVQNSIGDNALQEDYYFDMHDSLIGIMYALSEDSLTEMNASLCDSIFCILHTEILDESFNTTFGAYLYAIFQSHPNRIVLFEKELLKLPLSERSEMRHKFITAMDLDLMEINLNEFRAKFPGYRDSAQILQLYKEMAALNNN